MTEVEPFDDDGAITGYFGWEELARMRAAQELSGAA